MEEMTYNFSKLPMYNPKSPNMLHRKVSQIEGGSSSMDHMGSRCQLGLKSYAPEIVRFRNSAKSTGHLEVGELR